MSALASIGHNNPPTEMEILNERLASHETQEEQFKSLSSREIPETIQDEQEAGTITDHIKALKILKSEFETIFTNEKKPFWDCCKAADNWKNGWFRKIDALIDGASIPVLAFNKKREEEERKRQLEIARKAREEADRLALEAAAHEEVGIQDTADELMDRAVQNDVKADMIYNNVDSGGVTVRSRGDYSSASNRKAWTGRVESRAALDLELLRKYFADESLDKAIKAAVRDGVRSIRGAIIEQETKLSIR